MIDLATPVNQNKQTKITHYTKM